MAVITIQNSGRQIYCEDGSNLMQVLHNAGEYIESPCGGGGTCGKCKVKIIGDNVSDITKTETEILTAEEKESGVRLACMTFVTGDIIVHMPEKEKGSKVLNEGYVPEFEKDKRSGYGAAVDIGTTTVALSLVNLETGEEVSSSSQINAQRRFGSDVLTRITYEYENGEKGIAELQKALGGQLDDMLKEACDKADVNIQEVAEIVVAANCTMTHMLLGTDARPLGKSPYTPVFIEPQERKYSEIGGKYCKGAKLYCLPQVSAYIGADIVAGAHVCNMANEKGNLLFIDIGTNGEIVLATEGRLFSCSCAAGPALEGANISCGMRAAEGAVEDIIITDEKTELKVIGDTKLVGICGSGILAAVRELLKNGFIKPSGVFIKKSDSGKGSDKRLILQGTKRAFMLSDNITITQDDIRQVQLAKGAILSGFTALLKKAGLEMNQLDKVLVAGQFGAHLPAESLTGVGILPPDVKDRIVYVGNSSKTGAYMALMSQKERTEMEKLAQKMEYMELAETENYENLFAGCMIFPDIKKR